MTAAKTLTLLIAVTLLIGISTGLVADTTSRYHAEQQHADTLYENGEYDDAMKRYKKLAKKGDSFSQYRVSYMYLEGQGEEEDLVEAFAWAYLAAQNGQKELKDYRDAVGSLVPEKKRRKAERRVDYYMRKWGNTSLAADASRGARHELRSCTGSRLGTRCEEVYAMQMPKFWATTPGHGGGSRGDGGSAAPSGSVASAQGNGAGGAVQDMAYYQELRARIRALDQYIGEEGGNVELGEFEVIEDDQPTGAENEGG
ncbi:hypothetical protein [Elongatibacter sediminis]|uniref:Sel1 repeat family protein n=1 Tax=Elongatibacter sediminis TaxID=3119006 RepID=A0AAW9R633_9GAMM